MKHDIVNIKAKWKSFKMKLYLGEYDKYLRAMAIVFIITWIGIGIYLFS